MVQEALVLIRGFQFGMLYNFDRSTVYAGNYNLIIVKSSNNAGKTQVSFIDKTMLWYQRLGHIIEKGLHDLFSKGMVKTSLKLMVPLILISISSAFMVNIIELVFFLLSLNIIELVFF